MHASISTLIVVIELANLRGIVVANGDVHVPVVIERAGMMSTEFDFEVLGFEVSCCAAFSASVMMRIAIYHDSVISDVAGVTH
jgi:hypothetical protein